MTNSEKSNGEGFNYNYINVREMDIDDIAPVFHLGEDIFTSDLYPFLYRTWEQWEVIGLYNTDPEYCLVAEIDEQLAGFVLGTIINKPSWTYGYIIWLGVNPQFQRRGVGDKLVDKLVERMIENGVRFMMVDTDPANIPAVKFFTRKGFGNTRQHIFLSMNLSKHDYYGRLISYEREKADRSAYKRSRRRQTTKPQEIVNEAATRVMITDTPTPSEENLNPPPIS